MRRLLAKPHLIAAVALLAAAVPASAVAAEGPAPAAGETTAPAAGETSATTTSPAPPPASTTPAAPAVPTVQGTVSQSPSSSAPAKAQHQPAQGSQGASAEKESQTEGTGVRAKQKAVAPSTLTPNLPFALGGPLSGVPSFFVESFGIPPFLLPIFQAAGTAYGVPWQVLAAINEVETDYGRDLSVSSAGAEGWMQFLPAEWAQYGVDANGDGYRDPYNPADAIFAAARYLRAAGGDRNIRAAVFSYNHSQAYVDSVLLRAQLLGGMPPELLGAVTALTEARFPVHAGAHFSDGFPTLSAGGGHTATLVGTTIYAAAGAPVIAVQDGEVVQIGQAPALGRFVVLRDAFGNTYTYARLGDVASLYPVLEPHVASTVSSRIGEGPAPAEPAPRGPATAGVQPRSPISEGATVSGLALGAAAGLEGAASPPPAQPATPPPSPAPPRPGVHVFRSGVNDVYLHQLRPGVQVIAGTVLGHLGASAGGGLSAAEGEPHIVFQIRPAGLGAPLIDPKPILDGWVALENTSIFRAKGENPFLATSPTVGQVLLESKQQLEQQVLHDGGIRLGRCGHDDVQEGRVDKRVLALLEYMSVSALKPTVGGLHCPPSTQAASAANAAARSSAVAVKITSVNGIPIAGHQGQGSIADIAVRKLLGLQGASRPQSILSLMSYPGAKVAVADPAARNAIEVSYPAPAARGARFAGALASALAPRQWVQLVARLGEIPDPTVAHAPSSSALPDAGTTERGGSGHH
jgi:murein DD-endopeptidase MepM/ murein hydrolase activator NlpD